MATAMEVEQTSDMDVVDDLKVLDPPKAIAKLQSMLGDGKTGADAVRQKERVIMELAALFVDQGRADDLRQLLTSIRPYFATIPKAKTAKIVRTIIDQLGQIPKSAQLQADVLRESIDWCRSEKRSFLRQRLEARLAKVMFELSDFKAAIKLINKTAREVKKVDDKILLVEIHLIESKVHHALRNIPKSKGALTSARSAASSIYCPPLLQAEIDLQAGIISCEEKDYKTGFSYFYEAFEGYNTVTNPPRRREAAQCMKYMLLAKIMTNAPAEVYSLINGRAGVQYASKDVEALKSVADAHKDRSIHAYKRVLETFKEQLVDDPIIYAHLNQLYENLLEQNLLRLIEPFSRVQIDHVAALINLPRAVVETKLSEMILDGKLKGILDQGSGDLIIFDEDTEDKTFETTLQVYKELNLVADKLYAKAARLH